MKINWHTFGEFWSFRYLAEHIIKKTLSFKHFFDSKEKSDIDILLSPSQFKYKKADSKTILHIDSNRWYDFFIKENKND